MLCAAAGVAADAAPRIEARSAELLAVGVVHGDAMTLHISRLADNAPVRDATVQVVLRGVTHPTVAEADGSYSLATPDLKLPGTAGVLFEVDLKPGAHQELKGTLQTAETPNQSNDKGSARQLGWWALNFAVCISFLLLWSRRKARATKDA
jgi:hypothetical protein